MTKNEANAYLDRIREGYPVSLVIATQALQRTGDIPDFPDKPLRTNGDEPWIDRSRKAYGQEIQNNFSWSRYLDCQTVERN